MTPLVMAGAAVGCGGKAEPSPSASVTAGFPSLEAFDHSCSVDKDCVVVTGEGCGACSKAALSSAGAANYRFAYKKAAAAPSCVAVLQRAGACTGEAVAARCVAGTCGVLVGDVPR